MKKRISRKQAIESKCHDCMTGYEDGKKDCRVVVCPLYGFMPYRSRKPNLDWQQYSPRRRGLVSWNEINRREPAKNDTENPLYVLEGGAPTGNNSECKSYRKREHREQETRTGDDDGSK